MRSTRKSAGIYGSGGRNFGATGREEVVLQIPIGQLVLPKRRTRKRHRDMNNEPKNAGTGDLGPYGRVQDCWTRHKKLKDKSDLNHGTCEPMVESGRDTSGSERQIHFRGNMPDDGGKVTSQNTTQKAHGTYRNGHQPLWPSLL